MQKSIIIIGGGILGATASYYLASAGHEVTVLEKAEIASAASGANLGQISLMDREEPWHAKAALDSLAVYEKMMEHTDIEYVQSGGCAALQNEEQYDAVCKVKGQLAAFGIEIQFLQGENVLKHEPNLDPKAVYGIAYCPKEGKLNPLLTTIAFFDMAKALGVKVYEHTTVTGFELKDGEITKVLTDKGEFRADIIVNAAGSWTGIVGKMAGITIPIHYHRGTACVSQPVGPAITGPIVGGGVFLTRMGGSPEKRHIGLATVQTKHGSVIIAQATEEMPVDDKEISVQGLCATARKFVGFFPSLTDLEIVRAWAAVTPYTDDHLPVFGFSSKVKNFFTVAGFKGAFTTAPAVGQKVVEAIDNGLVWEGGAFSPERTI